MISSYIRLSMRFSLDGSSHVSGVGYHLRLVSVPGSWNSWFSTLLGSSGYLVISVNCSFDIDCRFFAWLGVIILKVATVVFGLRVIVWQVSLVIWTWLFFSVICVRAGGHQ